MSHETFSSNGTHRETETDLRALAKSLLELRKEVGELQKLVEGTVEIGSLSRVVARPWSLQDVPWPPMVFGGAVFALTASLIEALLTGLLGTG